MKLAETNRVADLDAELGTSANPSYVHVCRSCFLNFERYKKLQDTLLTRMTTAVNRMTTLEAESSGCSATDGSTTPTRIRNLRKRSATGEELPTAKRTALAQHSPTVQVIKIIVHRELEYQLLMHCTEVQVEYKEPRVYNFTPRRKALANMLLEQISLQSLVIAFVTWPRGTK